MKRKKRLMALGALLVCAAVGASLETGCTTNQQRIAYNTLYSIEQTTTGAYDGYIDAVIQGATPTNSVPQVSGAYNKFQASFLVALDAAEYNTNAVAPASLVVESQDVVNLITTLKGK